MHHRISEVKVAQAVTDYLQDAGGSATIGQIRRALPKFAELTPADQAPSKTRPNEQIWEQQVRNIVCHRDSEGNAVREGKIVWSPGRLSLRRGPQGELFDED